jgi:VIT1/CCC1 family predicted Fe2+/Mn2+ transporter
MTTTKTALLSILIACWIVGLLNQFHAWDSVLRYLILSLLIAAVVGLKAEYSKQFAKSRISKRP